MRFLPVAAFALMLLPGCPGPHAITPGSPGEEGRIHADLPAPNGFTYTENHTFTNPTGAFRVLTQKLDGPNRRVKNTAAFYRDTFPVHGWKLKSEDGSSPGPVTLTFERKEERCRVSIRGVTARRVEVVLKVNRRE